MTWEQSFIIFCISIWNWLSFHPLSVRMIYVRGPYNKFGDVTILLEVLLAWEPLQLQTWLGRTMSRGRGIGHKTMVHLCISNLQVLSVLRFIMQRHGIFPTVFVQVPLDNHSLTWSWFCSKGAIRASIFLRQSSFLNLESPSHSLDPMERSNEKRPTPQMTGTMNMTVQSISMACLICPHLYSPLESANH